LRRSLEFEEITIPGGIVHEIWSSFRARVWFARSSEENALVAIWARKYLETSNEGLPSMSSVDIAL
jgi:hypothetical protein